MATFLEALRQKNTLSPVLLRRSDIRGVGIGYADPSKPSHGAAVIVYTRKKIISTDITKLIRTTLGREFPIRMISTGAFRPHGTTTKVKRKLTRKLRPTLFRSRIRPVPGGTSIGRVNPFSTGTAGLITIKNNQLYILSNNHVLIRGNSPAFSPTVQPGPADGGQLASDRVGQAFEFIPFNLTGVNFMDAAIASPLNNSNSLFNPRYLMDAAGTLITVPGHLNSYRVGETFIKSGRTTGSITGTVESIGVDSRVGPYAELGGAVLLFRNQTIIVGPVIGGDSGSVWLRQSDRFAAALLFAGSENRSVNTPIGSVMSTFGLRVAIPASKGGFRSGAVKGWAPHGNFAYVRPLMASQRKRIKAILVRK
ncbi:hypothetical protein D3C73_601310 [compost metagenome]